MNIYRLYPPFLYVPEEEGFSAQWEEFCLRLLNLDNKTNNVERREAPEKGIDLYNNKEKIAYQCKSYEFGSKINITKIIESLKTALDNRKNEKWEKYIICTNENLTGSQQSKIKAICKDVEFKGKSYWLNLCNMYPEYVNKYFRTTVSLNKKVVEYTDYLYNPKLHEIKRKLEVDNYEYLNFVSDKSEKIYKIPIRLEISISDFMYLLREMLNLNDLYKETCGNYYVREEIIFKGQIIPYNENDKRSLREIGLENKDIFFYAINIVNKKLDFDKSELQLLKSENTININDIKKDIFVKFDIKIKNKEKK